MKKIILLSCCAGLLGMLPSAGFSWSRCESYHTAGFVFGCDTEDQGGKDYSYGTVIQTVGKGWCLSSNNTKVQEYYNARFRCDDESGVDDSWVEIGRNYCSDSEIQAKTHNVEHARYCVADQCVDSWDAYSGGKGYSGAERCLKITCRRDLGYAPSADKMKCVKACRDKKGDLTEPGKFKEDLVHCFDTHEAKLQSGDKVKNGAHCQLYCDESSNWVLKVTEDACASGYIPNADSTGCEKSEATKRKEAAAAEKKRKDAAAAAEQKRQEELDANQRKCQESFGEWKNGACFCDSSKNLTQNTKFDCKCVDESIYQKNPETKQCELTGAEKLRILCNSDAAVKSGAFWDGTNCNCSPDGRNRPRNFEGGKCVLSAEIVKCDMVQGANGMLQQIHVFA